MRCNAFGLFNSQKKQTEKKRSYLLNEKTPFNVTEAFRNLKSSLSVCMPKQADLGKIISVTSALPDTGKTTVSVNLALMFALSNKKVVVVDADIRKGRVAKFFRFKHTDGLSNYLAGQIPLKEIVQQSKINENLYFIPCGAHSPRPYELLESEEMKKLLQTLREEYDYVIIDTSPILLVADALAFVDAVDGTVLVCRQNHSNINDVEKAVGKLKFAGANLLGCVVNDYNAQQSGYYGKYGKYNYQYYAYNYAYTSEETSTPETSADTEKGFLPTIDLPNDGAEKSKQ